MNEAETMSLQNQIDAAMEAASALQILAQATEDQNKAEDCIVWLLNIETWIREWRNQLEVEA